jgi:hypothetical protein
MFRKKMGDIFLKTVFWKIMSNAFSEYKLKNDLVG